MQLPLHGSYFKSIFCMYWYVNALVWAMAGLLFNIPSNAKLSTETTFSSCHNDPFPNWSVHTFTLTYLLILSQNMFGKSPDKWQFSWKWCQKSPKFAENYHWWSFSHLTSIIILIISQSGNIFLQWIENIFMLFCSIRYKGIAVMRYRIYYLQLPCTRFIIQIGYFTLKNKCFVCPNKEMKKRVGRSISFFYFFIYFFLPKDTLRRKHDRISLLYICKHISLL